ncbi:MAG TPA: hypothetical protein VFX24_04690 [Ktedonobacterales bacterium]|nr:hypothetical protein [Ktedonobacterales bacterium]
MNKIGAKRTSTSWMRALRALWLALSILALGLFAASLPAYYALIQRPCNDPATCNVAGALTAQSLQQLTSMGFSIQAYAALMTAFFTLIVAIWSGIGFLIFWRRPNDWFALFTALFLVIFNATYPDFPITALALAYPALNVPIGILGALGVYSIIAFLVLFPNGRLVPRWLALILVLGAVGSITTAFPNLPFGSGPEWLDPLINIPQYAAIIGAQIYRYRKVSTPTERQQTKWVVFGIVIVMIGISLPYPLFSVLVPASNQSNTIVSTLLGLLNYPIVLLALPITIGIAILRSRLYEIDVIINRTLVYGSLTAILALIYVAGVVGAQAIVNAFTQRQSSEPSPILIVVTTLVIAALFQPLRRRLQRVIDRRFYRHKYDATRTLNAFSARQRSEVDLNALSQHLMAVVQETMQPAHISLWLRSSEITAKHPREGI